MIKRIKSDKHIKELLRGSAIGIFFKVFGALVQYLFFWVLANYFYADGVGVFSILWTILMVLTVLSKLGFDTAIVKLIATYISTNKKALIPKLYKRVIIMVLMAACVFASIIACFSKSLSSLFFENQLHVKNLLIVCIAIIPLTILQINSEVFKGLKKITLHSLFQNGSIYFLSILFIVISYQFFNNELIIYWSIGGSILLLLILSGIFIRKEISTSIKDFALKTANLKTNIENNGKLLKLSLPMLLSNSLFLILNWTDIIMLGAFVKENSVGIYNIAIKIAAINSLVLVGVNSIAMPKYAELHAKQNVSDLRKFVKQTTLLVFSLSLPILLVILFMPETLLGFFGSEFKSGVNSLLILTLGQAFSAFSSSSIGLLNMTGKEICVRNILVFTVILNMIANYILIPLYDINGAAIATSFSTILWNVLAVIVIYRNFKFTTYPVKTGIFRHKK